MRGFLFTGLVQDHARASKRSSAESSQGLLIRAFARSCKDLYKRGPHTSIRPFQKELCKSMQDLHKIFSKGSDMYMSQEAYYGKNQGAWTCHKTPFMREFPGKMPQTKAAITVPTCTWTCHKSWFMRAFSTKMSLTKAWRPFLCELAQAKCMWTCQKSRFTGRMQQTKTAIARG